MTFSISKYTPLFESADRNRGSAYFRDEAVEICDFQSERVTSQVAGSYGDYEVVVDLKSPGESYCECPRYYDGYFCKHLWATLLKIDEIGTLQTASAEPATVRASQTVSGKSTGRKPKAGWRDLISLTQQFASDETLERPFISQSTAADELWYIVDLSRNGETESLMLSLRTRDRHASVNTHSFQYFNLSERNIQQFDNPIDREILMALDEVNENDYYYRRSPSDAVELPAFIADEVLPMMAGTGRFVWTISEDLLRDSVAKIPVANGHDASANAIIPTVEKNSGDIHQIRVDANCIWQIVVAVKARSKQRYEISVRLDNGTDAIAATDLILVTGDGVILAGNRLLRLRNVAAASWLMSAFKLGDAELTDRDRGDFIRMMLNSPGVDRVEYPDEWQLQSDDTKCTGKLVIRDSSGSGLRQREAVASFLYGDADSPIEAGSGGHVEFEMNSPLSAEYCEQTGRIVHRDRQRETELVAQLKSQPFIERHDHIHQSPSLDFDQAHAADIIRELAASGWIVIYEGRRVRGGGCFEIEVESGQDWFDLSVQVDFEGQQVALPALLAALASNGMVTLADGTRGQVPEELLKQISKWRDLGEVQDDSIRYRPTQAMLLDAMLSAQPQVKFDRAFRKLRKKLQEFDGIKPKDAPRSFVGELRDYQRDGIGWLHFLREFGFGGCLADDMGLGKTIQVLSLLESRRTRRLKKNETRKPSIVVVPKSLIFNWIDEVAKFTPKLRVFNYTGTDRKQRFAESGECHVLLTTYGTMRQDVETLSKTEFDYAVLDESQAIKNHSSLAAKASRLLVADHRLAMTGTPIENHVGELWSLFEFLNPGMLGSSRTFSLPRKASEEERSEHLETLSRGLRPFVLRRTKQQVLKDLPEKTEQTLMCDMTPAQKKHYDEIRDYYRIKLAKKVETVGLKNAKIHVLEALLRLRQVACDPRLLDKKKKPGVKLELLVEQLDEILEEGHKALVFSQFTSLLSLLQKQLTKKKVPFEYLDGKTRDRRTLVEKFQKQDGAGVFLISLKAGGSGLNLTQADYVYILDPWWNPAVEAQAIDRAHRIGQKRSVNAYRLICRDTVEEKIVELQKSKKQLADSIISADSSLIQSLTGEDLQMLLS